MFEIDQLDNDAFRVKQDGKRIALFLNYEDAELFVWAKAGEVLEGDRLEAVLARYRSSASFRGH
jgi:hypothetical protein